MAELLQEVESVPASWPALGEAQSTTWVGKIDPAPVWQRLEAYVAHRWTPRAVVWTVEGPGEWVPRLTPATLETVEVWDDGWTATTVGASPLGGYVFDGDGPYRVTATVGGGTVPEAVLEAFRRLAEYMAPLHDAASAPDPTYSAQGAAKVDASENGISLSVERNPAWVARAIVNSGAGDLLRPYRRAPGC